MSDDVKPSAAIKEHRPSEVIYQVYPASFADSDGDGHGDIRGITAKLDYIKSLNVDAVWVSPFYLSPPGPEGDGGYAVTDHKAIDPRFGTLDDFKELLKEAHGRGLRIYTDFVLPHTAGDHEWFEKSRRREEPFKDYYVWHDGSIYNGHKAPPNNWKSVFGGEAWTFDPVRRQYYLHHFLKSQPALNLNNEKVQEAVVDEMKFWLDMGVDGFRIDSLPYANHDPEFRHNPWMFGQWPDVREAWDQQFFEYSICQPQTVKLVARIRKLMDGYDRKKTTLGEAIAGKEGGKNALPVASTYVHRHEGLDTCYSDVSYGIAQSSGQGYLKDLIKRIEDHFPDGGHCNSLGNHDNPRTMTRVAGHLPQDQREAAYRQIAMLFLCLPGSLCVYQGEELGLPQARIPEDIPLDRLQDPVAQTIGIDRCRDGARTPMPWRAGAKNSGFTRADKAYLPVPHEHDARAVDRQESDPRSTLRFMREALAWRAAQPALLKGHTVVLDTKDPVLAFLRRCEGQVVLCAFNLSPHAVTFTPSEALDDDLLRAAGLQKGQALSLDGYGFISSGDKKPVPVAAPLPNLGGAPKPAPG